MFESEADGISFVTYKWLISKTEDQRGSWKRENKAKETKGKEKTKKILRSSPS